MIRCLGSIIANSREGSFALPESVGIPEKNVFHFGLRGLLQKFVQHMGFAVHYRLLPIVKP